MIQTQRIHRLNDKPVRAGHYVLYWMQASQRARCNHALEYAMEQANATGLPLAAVFGISPDVPRANLRHYRFMFEGLPETADALARRGVQLAVVQRPPPQAAIELARDAAMVIADVGYLRWQRQWRREVARRIACRMVAVEADVIVPVAAASTKEEYAARTLRPRIARQLADYLVPLRSRRLKHDSLGLRLGGEILTDIDSLMEGLSIDRSIQPVESFHGGERHARRWLNVFLARKLADYEQTSNDPSCDGLSNMSPYLHFGQISPLEIALAVQSQSLGGPGPEAYLEELIVHRELAINFVSYNPHYDTLRALPAWAAATLRRHGRDRRPVVYSYEQFAAGDTHDPAWNAAQREMVLTGKMHGYMRMYWAKKILEWTRTPREAHRIALTLNDVYELDGRDPSGFANVLWCFGKHDRPWGERPIFGTVRTMTADGLRRKFDVDAYIRRIARLVRI